MTNNIQNSTAVLVTEDQEQESKVSCFSELLTGHALRCLVAETLGTLLLVMLGCMCTLGGWSGAPSLVQVGVGFGMVVMFVIQIFGHISGAHVNPCITLAGLIWGSMSVPMAALYVVGQMVGSVAGFGLLLLVTPSNLEGGSDAVCVTLLGKGVTPAQGVLVEIVITAVLVLVTCAVWDPCNCQNTDSVPIRFGLTITSMVISSGSYTGASMNPARSFGPALWNNNWNGHWVYWVGPILGSAIAALLYRGIFKKSPPSNEPETMPLNETVKSNKETA